MSLRTFLTSHYCLWWNSISFRFLDELDVSQTKILEWKLHDCTCCSYREFFDFIVSFIQKVWIEMSKISNKVQIITSADFHCTTLNSSKIIRHDIGLSYSHPNYRTSLLSSIKRTPTSTQAWERGERREKQKTAKHTRMKKLNMHEERREEIYKKVDLKCQMFVIDED